MGVGLGKDGKSEVWLSRSLGDRQWGSPDTLWLPISGDPPGLPVAYPSFFLWSPFSLQNVFPLIAQGQRSATSQAVYQLFGMFVTLVFASVGGSLGGEWL